MLRRLCLLLVCLMASATLLPAEPAQAAPVHGHHQAAPAGHCGDQGHGAAHICLGCAVDPADPAPVEPTPPVAALIVIARPVSVPADHRPGFDPPPPRGA